MKLINIKYRLLSVTAFLLLSILQVQAQRDDVQEWPYARLILAEGDTIYGSLVYHRNEDVVRLRHPDGSVSAFSPMNIAGFDVSDSKSTEQKRYFRTYRWNKGNDYSNFTVPTFFEQLNVGKYALLLRQSSVRRDVSRDPMYRDPYGRYGRGPMYVNEVRNSFYLLTPEQKVITLRNVKKDLLNAFGDKSRAVKDFVKENRLSYSRPSDLIAIVNYYNSLQ